MSSTPPETKAQKPPRPPRRRQQDRSEAMRLQLITATVASLVDLGYARTTTVEIAQRAGVTRGALLHHFEGLPDLYAATLAHIYRQLLESPGVEPHVKLTGAALVEGLWRHFSQPEYKAVIELWLAARNEPALVPTLQPAILMIRDLADPRVNPRLVRTLGKSEDAVSLYRLVIEAMIGMALGRAVTPGVGVLGHEERVVGLLSRIAGSILDAPD